MDDWETSKQCPRNGGVTCIGPCIRLMADITDRVIINEQSHSIYSPEPIGLRNEARKKQKA